MASGPGPKNRAKGKVLQETIIITWGNGSHLRARRISVGAWPQRLLWASTGVKDPLASNVLYVKALAAPFTINTMPEGTLKALSEETELGSIMAADGGDCEEVLTAFSNAGIDIDSMAAQLQEEEQSRSPIHGIV